MFYVENPKWEKPRGLLGIKTSTMTECIQMVTASLDHWGNIINLKVTTLIQTSSHWVNVTQGTETRERRRTRHLIRKNRESTAHRQSDRFVCRACKVFSYAHAHWCSLILRSCSLFLFSSFLHTIFCVQLSVYTPRAHTHTYMFIHSYV